MRTYEGTVALQRFDRTEALHDGRVVVDRLMVGQVLPSVGVKGLLNGTFDVAEMPLAHYALLRDRGERFTALPVFPDRVFVQPYVLVRRGGGITSLADLAGRHVSVPMYYMTSSIWHRALLREAGVDDAEVGWIVAEAERDAGMQPPAGVGVRRVAGPHLSVDRLFDGTADCVMTEGLPRLEPGRREEVVCLHPDVDAAVRDYFRRTQVHPIMHVIVAHRSFADRFPELLWDLCRGFDLARQAAYDLLQNERMTGLPLTRSHLDETERLFGRDPWPYGLSGRNLEEIDQFLGHALAQGLIGSRLRPADLFDNPTVDYAWQARMTPGADLAGMESLTGAPALPGPLRGAATAPTLRTS